MSVCCSRPAGGGCGGVVCALQYAGAHEGMLAAQARMPCRRGSVGIALRLRGGQGDEALAAGASAAGSGANDAGASAEEGEHEREKRKRASVLSNTIFLRGLPEFANEEWIAILIGRTSVATDEKSGARKVYI